MVGDFAVPLYPQHHRNRFLKVGPIDRVLGVTTALLELCKQMQAKILAMELFTANEVMILGQGGGGVDAREV